MPPLPAYCVHLSKGIVVTMGLCFGDLKMEKFFFAEEILMTRRYENTALS